MANIGSHPESKDSIRLITSQVLKCRSAEDVVNSIISDDGRELPMSRNNESGDKWQRVARVRVRWKQPGLITVGAMPRNGKENSCGD